MKNKNCKKCDGDILNSWQYCPMCGERLEQETVPKCPVCHKNVLKDARFCASCSLDLELVRITSKISAEYGHPCGQIDPKELDGALKTYLDLENGEKVIWLKGPSFSNDCAITDRAFIVGGAYPIKIPLTAIKDVYAGAGGLQVNGKEINVGLLLNEEMLFVLRNIRNLLSSSPDDLSSPCPRP